ncbi:MAG: nuclear transport factor 2 family protein [Actinomycetota bacterium]
MSNAAASAFRSAVEAGDLDSMLAVLSDDVVLHSPVSFKPFRGKDAVRGLFSILMETFEDFHYTDHVEGDGVAILVFRARVGDREVEGIDLLRAGTDGRVDDFTVMVRPLSGINALWQAVGARLSKGS